MSQTPAQVKGLRVGDRVRGISNSNEGKIFTLRTDDNSSCPYFVDEEGRTSCEWLSEVELYQNKTNNNKIMTNIKKVFSGLFVKEPQKTFQKLGITDASNELTAEGREIYLQYKFNQDQEAFKKDVCDPIVEAQKEEEAK